MKKADSWYYDNSDFMYLKGHSHSKRCCCGGHNHSNPKKNKHHHSTRMKLLRKQVYKFKKEQRNVKIA